MTSFPDLYGTRLRMQPRYRTVYSEVGEQRVVKYRKFLRPRWIFDIGFSLLTDAEAKSISDHVLSHGGATAYFDIFLPFRTGFHWFWVPVGTGDGAQTVFDLPSKGLTDSAFFKNGATSITGVVSLGGGAGGVDRITFDAAPESGAPITMSGRFRRKFEVRFENDAQPLPKLVMIPEPHYTFATRLVSKK